MSCICVVITIAVVMLLKDFEPYGIIQSPTEHETCHSCMSLQQQKSRCVLVGGSRVGWDSVFMTVCV
jgi:hypothetical protein